MLWSKTPVAFFCTPCTSPHTGLLPGSSPATLTPKFAVYWDAAQMPALPWDSSSFSPRFFEGSPVCLLLTQWFRCLCSFMITSMVFITPHVLSSFSEPLSCPCGLALLQLSLPGCRRQISASFTCYPPIFFSRPLPTPLPVSAPSAVGIVGSDSLVSSWDLLPLPALLSSADLFWPSPFFTASAVFFPSFPRCLANNSLKCIWWSFLTIFLESD